MVNGFVSRVVLVSPLIVFMEDVSTSQDSIAKSYNFSQLKPRNPLMQPDLLCWHLNFFLMVKLYGSAVESGCQSKVDQM